MKNIEKYKETKAALDAWGQSVKGGLFLSFDEWAHREYEAPRAPTLLEAAEAVKNTWESQWQYGSLSVVAKAISDLSGAIDREKEKPVRNFDKYKTTKEAYGGFIEMCHGRENCNGCRFFGCYSASECAIAYLYADAEKEVK